MTTTVPFGYTPTFPTFGTQPFPFAGQPFANQFGGPIPGFTPVFNQFTGMPVGYTYTGTTPVTTPVTGLTGMTGVTGVTGSACCQPTGTTQSTATQAWTANGVPLADPTGTTQAFAGQPGATYPYAYTGVPTYAAPWTTPFAYNPFINSAPTFGATPTWGTTGFGGTPTWGAGSYGATPTWGAGTYGCTPTFGTGFGTGFNTFGATPAWNSSTNTFGGTPGFTPSLFGQTPWFQPGLQSGFQSGLQGGFQPGFPTTIPTGFYPASVFQGSTYPTTASTPFTPATNWFSPTSSWNNNYTTPFAAGYGATPFGYSPSTCGTTFGNTPSLTPWTSPFVGAGATGVTPWSFQQTPWLNSTGTPSFPFSGFNGVANNFYGAQAFSPWTTGYGAATVPGGLFSFPQAYTGVMPTGAYNGYQPSFYTPGYTPGVSVPFGYGQVPFTTPFGQTVDTVDRARRGIGIREAA